MYGIHVEQDRLCSYSLEALFLFSPVISEFGALVTHHQGQEDKEKQTWPGLHAHRWGLGTQTQILSTLQSFLPVQNAHCSLPSWLVQNTDDLSNVRLSEKVQAVEYQLLPDTLPLSTAWWVYLL